MKAAKKTERAKTSKRTKRSSSKRANEPKQPITPATSPQEIFRGSAVHIEQPSAIALLPASVDPESKPIVDNALRFTSSTIAHVVSGQIVAEHANSAPCARCLALDMGFDSLLVAVSVRLQMDAGRPFDAALAIAKTEMARMGWPADRTDKFMRDVRFVDGAVLLNVP